MILSVFIICVSVTNLRQGSGLVQDYVGDGREMLVMESRSGVNGKNWGEW